MYQPAEVQQHALLSRIREVTGEDILRQFPDFHGEVGNMILRQWSDINPDDVEWFLVRSEYDDQIPYVMFPHGDARVYYEDPQTRKCTACDDGELELALKSTSKKEPF